MTSRIAVSSVFLAVLATSSAAGGESVVPLVSKERTTEIRINSDGAESVLRTQHGLLYRSSSGSELRVTDCDRDGRNIRRAVLQDVKAGKSYDIDYAARTARESPLRASLIPPATDEHREKAKAASLGEKVVGGLRCLEFPVINGPTGARTGTGCWSIDHSIRLQSQWELSYPGYQLRVQNEMYEIQVGVEPPAGSMEVPNGFRISR